MESNQNLIRANKQPAYSVTKTDGTEHSVGEAIGEMAAHETLTSHSGHWPSTHTKASGVFKHPNARPPRWDRKAGSPQTRPPFGPGR